MDDLSSDAVRSRVTREALQRPFTVYPAAAALLVVVYGLFNGTIATVLWLIGGFVGLAVLNWLWQAFVRRDKNARRIAQRIAKSLDKQRRKALAKLRKELAEIGDTVGLRQLKMFEQKYKNFAEMIERKLDPSELTYIRFVTAAEQVMLGGLDNLESITLLTKSVSAIDPRYIESELNRLKGRVDVDSVERTQALRERRELLHSRITEASNLHRKNEIALTQLDAVTAAIAEADTRTGRADVELEVALKDLHRLTERASSLR